MNKIFPIIICIIWNIGTMLAQEIPSPANIQSPNAASLGKYGDVKVSHFTGAADISVPIYSMSAKGIDLNIDLRYDASGIRIDQYPGWVGQNWTLSAGGVISRTIIGEPDEGTLRNTDMEFLTNWPDCGFFYHYNDLNAVNILDQDYLEGLAYERFIKDYDYQPDIFTFNFMGISGKFFLGNDGNWKVNSEDNIMVVNEDSLRYPLFEDFPVYPAPVTYKYPQVIAGFKLIDGNGTTYLFGYNDDAIEYSIDFFGQYFTIVGGGSGYGKPWNANAWYLTKVIDKYGTEVYRFDYERGSFIAHFYRGDNHKDWVYDGNGGLFNPAPGCATTSGVNNEQYYIQGDLISPTYLKSVYSPFSSSNSEPTITFNTSNAQQLNYDPTLWELKYNQLQMACYSMGGGPYPLYYLQIENEFIDPALADNYMKNLHWRKLDYINIYGDLTRRIKLNYNNDTTERLNLLSLDVISDEWPYGGDTEKYSYSFEYNQFHLLPGYLSKKQDHWGYYKGSAYSYNSNNLSSYYNQRLPDTSYLSIGMLSKIYYPTGGFTQFEFEPHSYAQIVTDDRQSLTQETGIAGGVRIKKIENFDGDSSINKLIYKYIADYSANPLSTISSGVLAAKPKYYWPDWRVSDGEGGEYSEISFSVNSIIPLSNSFGSYIGYSEVTELRNDNSFISYHYSNYDTSSTYKDELPLFNFNGFYSPYLTYTERNLMRGKLLTKNVYNSNKTLVRETSYKYRSASDMYQHYVLTTSVDMRNFCPGSAVSYYYGSSNKIYYFDCDLLSDETIDYLSGGAVSQKTTYTREDKHITNLIGNTDIRLLKSTKIVGSDKDILSKYFYPTDFLDDDNMQILVDSFRINELVKETKLSLSGNTQLPIGVNKTTYKMNNNILVKDKEYSSSTDENNLEEFVSYDEYSSDGLLLQYTTREGIPVSLLWDTRKNYLKAKIENANYLQVSSLNWNGANGSSIIMWNSLNQLVPDAVIRTFSYRPLVGLTSETDQNGVITKYYYDHFGRLETIFDVDGNVLKHMDYHYKE